MLPNFLLIGAGKAGTTSLHHYLAEHPRIFMPREKELKYFACAGEAASNCLTADGVSFRVAVTSLQAYTSHFQGVTVETAIGEASPQYIGWPSASARIRETIPHARIIAILRQPIDRALSSFNSRFKLGLETRPFVEALEHEKTGARRHWRSGRLLDLGLYHKHLSRYYALFPKEQIKVVLYEDLVADPARLLRDLCRFLGVDPDFAPDMEKRYNVTGTGFSLRLIRRKLRRGLDALVWRGGRTQSGRVFGVRPPDSRLSDVDEAHLLDYFRQDVTALQGLIDRDLDHWLLPRSQRSALGP